MQQLPGEGKGDQLKPTPDLFMLTLMPTIILLSMLLYLLHLLLSRHLLLQHLLLIMHLMMDMKQSVCLKLFQLPTKLRL